MNYESVIEEIILSELSYKYNIKNYDVLFRYLYLRFMSINFDINKMDKHLFIKDFSKFLMNEELGIIEDTYCGEKISYISGFDNSIANIVDNLFFSARMKSVILDDCDKAYEFDDYINNLWKKVKKYAINKSSKYKESKYYKYHLIYNRLDFLNNYFNIEDIKEVRIIEGFKQNVLYDYIQCEDMCRRYIHSSNFNTNNARSITEEELESYIFKNLELIEVGLKPIQRQVIVEEGRIDILAKDKDNNFVILELKVNDDKHLIWQVLYYPYAIKEVINSNKVRVITVCPSYPKYILNPLSNIDNVEIIQFNPLISNNKIEKIDFIKLN